MKELNFKLQQYVFDTCCIDILNYDFKYYLKIVQDNHYEERCKCHFIKIQKNVQNMFYAL